MKIGMDSFVTINYTLTSQEETPVQKQGQEVTESFIYGRDRILPALEKNLRGCSKDDELELVIPPEHAFGLYDPSLVCEFPISHLQYPDKIQEGERYEERDKNGKPISFTVKEINEKHIVADFNHPYAGKSFTLKTKIVEVRSASCEEILSKISQVTDKGGG